MSQPRRAAPAGRLSQVRWWRLLAVVVAAVAVIGGLVGLGRALFTPAPLAQAPVTWVPSNGETITDPTSAATSKRPSRTPEPRPSQPSRPRNSPSPGLPTNRHMPSSGRYAYSSVDIPATGKEGRVRSFIVRVETSTGLRPNDVARDVAAILNDERSWTGDGRVRFRAVASKERADFAIYVSSPKATDKWCRPLDTDGLWNCRVGTRVMVNAERWLYATPTYPDDLAGYRAYLINHEVGHYLGHGHSTCPGKGKRAPVMLQQSISLRGCRPNPWPHP